MTRIFLLLAILIGLAYSLNFQISGNKQFCMRYEGGKKHTLEYVVSGNDDQNIQCTITQGSKIILEKDDVSEYEFTHDYQG